MRSVAPPSVVWLALAGACTRLEPAPLPTQQPAPAVAANEGPREHGNVGPFEGEVAFVRGGAKLYVDRELTRHVLTVHSQGLGLPVRISAVFSETVAVVTLPDRHCTTTIEPLNSVELRLHMRRSDFETVLREPLLVSYADGTEVRLQPGAAVANKKVYVHLGGERYIGLPIEAPPEKLGVSFPYVERESALTYDRDVLAPSVEVKLGNEPLMLLGHAAIADVKRGGDESVVRLAGACAEATVRVASAELEGTDHLWERLRWPAVLGEVPPDKEVTWGDGTLAGRTLGIDVLPELDDRADRKCWHPYAFVEDVELCVAAKDIVPPSTGEGTIGLGNVGLIGSGRPQPRVRQVDREAKIDGGLDRKSIRRVVRANIHEVRVCYNRGLDQDDTLRGRVAVTFTIAADGSVAESKVASHTVTDEVATCIASRIAKWTFPSPTRGGTVNVTYPFVLDPET